MGAVEKFVNARGPAAEGPYRCPCCGFITLVERSAFEICPVCFWEDDGQDDHDADSVRGGPNRALSLTAAPANFQSLGACDERCTRFVRPPRAQQNRKMLMRDGRMTAWHAGDLPPDRTQTLLKRGSPRRGRGRAL